MAKKQTKKKAAAKKAPVKAIRKAMRYEPIIEWLLENQENTPHYFHQLALEGKL